MPPNVDLSSLYCKRFDFGVPLEDVFPPNNIHPRLQNLFQVAYEAYKDCRCNIEKVLRELQDSLEVRLKLKKKVVNDIHYIDSTEALPGVYFWIIRHFLGVLPLPLFPEYTDGIKFDWSKLAQKCKTFFQEYDVQRKINATLDYHVAEKLSLLPFENVMLVKLLVVFIRKISEKFVKKRCVLHRKSIICLSKYFCAAIFTRPYRPGNSFKEDKIMFPLLFYIVLRWRSIEKKLCESRSYFLESLGNSHSNTTRNKCAQTTDYFPEIISVYKNTPHTTLSKNTYLDFACQTENDFSVYLDAEADYKDVYGDTTNNKKPFIRDVEDNKNEKNNNYKLTYVSDDSNTVDDLPEIDAEEKNSFYKTTVEDLNQIGDENKSLLYETAADFTFADVLKEDNINDWSDVVKETNKTVKKVEEYIYDDYETFRQEDFNQISKNKRYSLVDKISKMGWTYTPPKSSARDEKNRKKMTSTPKATMSSTYFKYPDVFEEETVTNNDKPLDRDNKLENESKTRYSESYLQKDSKASLTSNVGVKKKKFGIKRFIINFGFLRSLTTETVPGFRIFENQVKYKRIRSNTI